MMKAKIPKGSASGRLAPNVVDPPLEKIKIIHKIRCFRSSFPLFAWSVRDLFRYPFETILLFLSMAALVTILGTALLLSQALSSTAGLLLKNSPSVVVRRVNPTGWSALPAKESIRLAISVPGVLQAGTRIWGTANGPGGPLTVFGFDESHRLSGLTKSVPLPKRGEAVVGAGITTGETPEVLKLTGQNALILKIIDTLEAKTSMVAHDMVLVHPDDARRLLGIAEGYASDLIVDVFHETEAEAILPDLSRAFPWPVRMTTRKEAAGIYGSASARRSGIVYISHYSRDAGPCTHRLWRFQRSNCAKLQRRIVQGLRLDDHEYFPNAAFESAGHRNTCRNSWYGGFIWPGFPVRIFLAGIFVFWVE